MRRHVGLGQHGVPPRRRHLQHGNNEILVSGYAWHIPSTWTAEARAQENPNAWGGGWSRTLERDEHVTENVFFLVFNDSHSEPEYQIGYGWNYFWGERDSVQPGLGYTVMLVQRPDIANGIPFPAILPLFSLRYQKATLITTFIPTLNGGDQPRQHPVHLRLDRNRLMVPA